ncbi:sorbosone dehydrogenase family protein [Paenibacillus sp. TAF58]
MIFVILLALSFGITSGCSPNKQVNQPSPEQTSTAQLDIPYKMETVAEGLNVPWEMDIAKDGRIFFTERPGTLRVIEKGHLNPEPLITFEAPFIQDLNSTGGKILRIALDGSIPASNPFKNSPIYSMGHRNPQGLAWHPVTGQLYSSEHGQTAHDEINLIEPGGNYGWPLIEGDTSSSPVKANLKTPILQSGEETWAPSGAAFVSKGPWKGSLLVAGLRGERLLKVNLKGPNYDKVTSVEHLFQGKFGRLRNVYEGPDGSLYLMTNNRDGRGKPNKGDDKLIRLKPNF